MSRMNPMNPYEPLTEKVHRQKPHDLTAMTGESEPYEPFSDMIWGAIQRGVTSLSRCVSPRPVSCSRKVQKVHRFELSDRSLAVLGDEPISRDVHAGFIGFMPMIGGLAPHREAISPVAVTVQVGYRPAIFKNGLIDMTGRTHASRRLRLTHTQ